MSKKNPKQILEVCTVCEYDNAPDECSMDEDDDLGDAIKEYNESMWKCSTKGCEEQFCQACYDERDGDESCVGFGELLFCPKCSKEIEQIMKKKAGIQ